MEEEMDIFNIIKKQRHLLFELEQIKQKLNIEKDAFDNLDDSKSLIDLDNMPEDEHNKPVTLQGSSIEIQPLANKVN